jgi:hypothetical protein
MQQVHPVFVRAAGVLLVAALGLAGCETFTSRSSNERLDSSTGMTVGIADRVMVFARTEARYSRSMRDYIYLGPVSTNRQGLREYFLWVGVATTLDRGYLAPEIALPSSVQLLVQGEPMVFDLRPWSETIPGLTPAETYQTPVALRGQLGARATRDQLRLLAEAAPTSIRIGSSDGRTRVFEVWEKEPVSWSAVLGTGN